jgi:hypothetical protein
MAHAALRNSTGDPGAATDRALAVSAAIRPSGAVPVDRRFAHNLSMIAPRPFSCSEPQSSNEFSQNPRRGSM